MGRRSLLRGEFYFLCVMIFVPHRIGSPRPVTGIALLFMYRWCSSLTGNTLMGRCGLLLGEFYFLCVDYFRTTQETHLWVFSGCYGDSFTFYV
jgi:hypothetical protein